MRVLFVLFLVVLSMPALAWEQQEHAIKSGAAFEDRISDVLTSYGFTVESHSGYGGDDNNNELSLKNSKERIALRQPSYTTLYGGPGRYDFLLLAPELEESVWIETKFQKTSGSIDEKAPYVFFNALSAVPGKHVIILVGGEGWRDGAVKWIYAAKDDRRFKEMANYPNKRVDVMNPKEFKAWLDQTFQRASK